MDMEGNPVQQEAHPGICFVGVTQGKADLLYSNMFRTGFARFLSEVWLVVRDEMQQAGLSSSTSLLAMTSKHALTSRLEIQYEELVSGLQRAKKCGLRVITQQPVQPS